MSENHRPPDEGSTRSGPPPGAESLPPSTEITALLILEDEANRRSTRAALEGMPGVRVVGERPELRSGLLLARQLRPRIVLLDLPDAYDDALNAAGSFKLDCPDVGLFLISNSLDPQVLLRAIRSGAQEVLKKPLDRVLLQEAVERVARSGASRSTGGPRTRSIVTVFGPKGGVGTTTIATNIAVALKTQFAVEAVLADFDAASGDAAHMLGLRADHSMADILRAPRLDSASVHIHLLRHATGLSVLAQPEDLNQTEPITPAHAGGILDALSASFEVVVIDAPHAFDEVSLELFDRSTCILVVLELSVPSIRGARRALDVFERLHYTNVPGRVRLIVNRYSHSRGFISLNQLQETLGVAPYHTIENNYVRMAPAVNSGRPICVDDPDAPPARDLIALAAKLADRESAPAREERPRRSLFERMVSR